MADNLTGEQLGELVAQITAGEQVSIPTALPGPQLPYLSFFPSDFWGHPKVGAMGRIDRGLPQLGYLRLLTKSWQEQCPCFLDNDPVYLASVAGCNPLDFQGDWKIVLDRFQTTEDGKYIYNRRMLKEYWKVAKPYLAKVNAGKETQEKRRGAKSSPTSLAGSSPISSPETEQGAKHTQNQNQNQKKQTPEIYISADESLRGRDDFEEKLLALVHALPKGRKFKSLVRVPTNVMEAMSDAIKGEAQAGGITELNAYIHILRRTAIYAGYVAQWDESQANFSFNPVDWFKDSHYNDDESTWERNDGKAVTPITSASRIPAGVARTRSNHSAAIAAIQFDRETRGDHRGDDAPSGTDEGNA